MRERREVKGRQVASRSRWGWWGLWALFCLLVACPEGPKKIPCQKDDDCGFPLICFQGYCEDAPFKPRCTVDEDCKPGFYCDGLHCQGGRRPESEKEAEGGEREGESSPQDGGPPEKPPPEKSKVERDRLPPKVIRQEPAPGSKMVAEQGLVVTAVFSEDVDAVSVRKSFHLFDRRGSPVRVEVRYVKKDRRAELRPLDPLQLGSPYEAELSRGVVDLAGNALAAAVRWTFTTRPPSGKVPQVLSTIPANHAASVPLNTEISATFNVAMNPATLTPQTMSLRYLGEAVPGTVRYEAASKRAIFLPQTPLTARRLYTVFISTSARSAQGVPLAKFYQWEFSTPPQ